MPPHIDSPAANGVRFTASYVTSCVCGPGSGAMMTGRYQQRFGFDANAEGASRKLDQPKGLDLAQKTFADRFKALGYATGIVGKWPSLQTPPAAPMRHLSSWFLIAISATPLTAAGLELGTPFRDHMVLQREKPVPVWGWAEAGDEVTVEFAGQRQAARAAADGKWMVRLDPLATNASSATLTVSSARSGGPLAVSDVLVGEVWLGSGQSNMKMMVQSSANFAAEKQAADLPLVRMFIETSDAAPQPQPRGAGEWHVSSPETVGTFSATL